MKVKIMARIADEYPGTEFEIKTIKEKEAIISRIPGRKGAPIIYVEDAQNAIDQGRSEEEVLDIIISSFKENSSIPGISDVEKAIKNKDLFIQLVNADSIKGKDIPHTTFLDLECIYRIYLPTSKGMSSAVITDLRLVNMTLEELHAIALEKTRELLPVKESKGDYLFKLLGLDKMKMLSNEKEAYGASIMLYPDIFTEGNIVVPFSINEILVLDDETNLEMHKEALKAINAMDDEEDKFFLSNSVYKFENGKLHIC